MQTIDAAKPSLAPGQPVQTKQVCNPGPSLNIGLLTACRDRHYAFALSMALNSMGVRLDVVGGDEIDSPELHATRNLRFVNFCSKQKTNASIAEKIWNLLVYYAKLIRYAAQANPRILHILWNNKLEIFDRTILMLYYKTRGKKIALTAHNVNGARRDAKDSFFNRATLKIQYRLCDHIFVHTKKMKTELCQDFQVAEEAVTVIPYPINSAVPDTELSSDQAKRHLGLRDHERVILFFGKIRPYKGIEHLIEAFKHLSSTDSGSYRMLIVGEPDKGEKEYLQEICRSVEGAFDQNQVILRFEFIPDEDLEFYFKGADVLVLPYREIFQSGVLFIAYRFGLPVVATDVGSFREAIVEGSTGFLCRAGDPADMARSIEKYFASDLFKTLSLSRRSIKEYADANYSWGTVAELSCEAYGRMLAE
jgi:glycosyltransferase involved in cell wall biosynthesis